MTSLTNLMEAVNAAPALNQSRPQRWKPLYDAYDKLRSKGYTCKAAVEFLKGEGAVPEGDEQKALNALQCITVRRNRKSQPQAKSPRA